MLFNDLFFIAEMSANHCGSLDLAKRIIYEADSSGASAVKIQVYSPESLTLNLPEIKSSNPLWSDKSLYDLYKDASMPKHWLEPLFMYANECGIKLFGTPFSEADADLLEKFNPPCYKIASFEITHIPLIKHVARFGKPMIISCGMASKEEIKEAVTAARLNGCPQIALLRCVSAYPAKIQDFNLLTLVDMKGNFPDCKIGLSDHSLSHTPPMTAVALGATVIEKHFKSFRYAKSPDDEFSLEPYQFEKMVELCNEVKESIGSCVYRPSQNEEIEMRRAIYAVKPISVGDVFTKDNIAVLRPCVKGAAHPSVYEFLLGRRAKVAMSVGDIFGSCLF